jgi:hypothetical protein
MARYPLGRLSQDPAHWQQLLTEIKKARSTFDMLETQKSFGVCVIDYEQVQAHVNAKYDSWQRDILSRFGVKLGKLNRQRHNEPEYSPEEAKNSMLWIALLGAAVYT